MCKSLARWIWDDKFGRKKDQWVPLSQCAPGESKTTTAAAELDWICGGRLLYCKIQLSSVIERRQGEISFVVSYSSQSAGKRTEISNIALSFFYFQDGLREERWENE